MSFGEEVQRFAQQKMEEQRYEMMRRLSEEQFRGIDYAVARKVENKEDNSKLLLLLKEDL